MAILCQCKECGKQFKTIPSRFKEGKGKFCSRHCRDRQIREFGWIKKTFWSAKNRTMRHPNYKHIEFRFESYEQLANAVGARPDEQHTLDRIDNNGHYEPGNVRWANWKTQNRNRRGTRPITFNGKTQILSDWAKELGTTCKVLSLRINTHGWSIERALTTPVRRRPS